MSESALLPPRPRRSHERARLTAARYASSVQAKVLSELPFFSDDCLVQAKTGTGKTLAFLLPALQSLLTAPPLRKGQVGILVLSPTRELASQIAKECDHVTAKLNRKVECHTAFGGTNKVAALNRFMNGSPSVLVATPGRLKDIIAEKKVRDKLRDLRTFVLDEADTMLEQGFLLDVQELLKLLPPKSDGWQGMCFSATIPPRIKGVAHLILNEPYVYISTVSTNETPTVEGVPQHYIIIPSVHETFASLHAVLQKE